MFKYDFGLNEAEVRPRSNKIGKQISNKDIQSNESIAHMLQHWSILNNKQEWVQAQMYVKESVNQVPQWVYKQFFGNEWNCWSELKKLLKTIRSPATLFGRVCFKILNGTKFH